MKRITAALTLIASTISLSAMAASSPVCAQVVNETNQTITLNVGNGKVVSKIINVGSGLKSKKTFRASSVAPEIQFASNTKRSGNISGTFVAYPGAVQLTKDGNITIQAANNVSKTACNVFWTISVFKG